MVRARSRSAQRPISTTGSRSGGHCHGDPGSGVSEDAGDDIELLFRFILSSERGSLSYGMGVVRVRGRLSSSEETSRPNGDDLTLMHEMAGGGPAGEFGGGQQAGGLACGDLPGESWRGPERRHRIAVQFRRVWCELFPDRPGHRGRLVERDPGRGQDLADSAPRQRPGPGRTRGQGGRPGTARRSGRPVPGTPISCAAARPRRGLGPGGRAGS